MAKSIISIRKLSKKYTLGERQPYYSFRDTISGLLHSPFNRVKLQKNEFWALRDISFDVNGGDVIGIVGKNGAGKSTLLKILSQITPPTEGEIVLRGRVASLLEVGTGFHPELTGRENIYLNGAVLGMKRLEINNKFNEIVDFAEIERFIDTPVKRYSSGMYMRLAFAVAAHLEPEILLVDEVLAVGDAQFQKKCLGKMSKVSKQGRTIIFVSHNMNAINTLCEKAILLEGGRIKTMGSVKTVISKYLSSNKANISNMIKYDNNSSSVQIYEVLLNNILNIDRIDFKEDLSFTIKVNNKENGTNFYLGIEILNEMSETMIFARDIEINPLLREKRRKGIYKYIITIPGHCLIPGQYILKLAIIDYFTKEAIDFPEDVMTFKISDEEDLLSKNGLPWRAKTSIPVKLVCTQA